MPQPDPIAPLLSQQQRDDIWKVHDKPMSAEVALLVAQRRADLEAVAAWLEARAVLAMDRAIRRVDDARTSPYSSTKENADYAMEIARVKAFALRSAAAALRSEAGKE